jgi:hypothetical protein
VLMKGLLWGNTTLQLVNSIIFLDKQHEIKSHVSFENNCNFKGSIYKFDAKKLKNDPAINFSKVTDILYEAASIKGNW